MAERTYHNQVYENEDEVAKNGHAAIAMQDKEAQIRELEKRIRPDSRDRPLPS